MLEERLFISYSWKDHERVRAVAAELQHLGLGVWIDQQEVQPTDSLITAIDEGIRGSRFFVLFASRHYFQGSWTRAEYEAAFQAALGADERRILLVRLDDSELPLLLAPRLSIDWSSPGGTAEDIRQAVERADRTGSAIASTAAKEVSWDELQKPWALAALDELLDRRGDLLRENGKTVRLEAEVFDDLKLTLHASRILLSNDSLIADLRMERRAMEIAQEKAHGYRERLLVNGLGIYEPAFKIALREAQQDLDETWQRLRAQLAALAPRIQVSGERHRDDGFGE